LLVFYLSCILFISIDVRSELELRDNVGLSYSFAVAGYEGALYEYWQVLVLDNERRSILWFQVFRRREPNFS
jgi:hypothetical protein